jgi:hypothetical protein
VAEPAPPPAAEPQPPPPPPPAPAPPVTAAPPVTWRSSGRGDCPDCGPDEWSLTVEASVAPGASAPLTAELPRSARFVGYRYEVLDGWGGGDCVGDQECAVGQARWLGHPRVERAGAATTVGATFENRSADRERRARLTVYFRPTAGWKPPAG